MGDAALTALHTAGQTPDEQNLRSVTGAGHGTHVPRLLHESLCPGHARGCGDGVLRHG